MCIRDRPQTAVGPMPVADIDLTSAILLYEYPFKLMLLGLHKLQVIVAGTQDRDSGQSIPAKQTPPLVRGWWPLHQVIKT